MGLVIKRKMFLDFLGEEYKDSYIVLKVVSVGEYEKLDGTVRQCVIDRFIDGEILQDSGMVKISKDQLEELPGDVLVKGFELITGVLDPKALGLSEKQFSTDKPSQEN